MLKKIMKSHVDEQLLTDANARLKAARISVTIRCRGEALYLSKSGTDED